MAIGIDIDEVLFPLVPEICKFLNKKHGISLSEESFISYDFWENPSYKINGVQANKQQAIEDFYEFIINPEFRKIRPYPGAAKAVFELKKLDRLVAITSRQTELQNHTKWQLGYFFPKAFSNIAFGNNYAKNSGPVITKRQLCRSNWVYLHLEDNLKYALEVSRDNLVILFKKPWNSEFDSGSCNNIHPVENLGEAVKIVKSIYSR